MKIDENQITYDFKEIHLQNYYESIEQQFAHDFTKHNIHFVVDSLPPFENLQHAYVYIDEFRMNQVFQNLLQNARKFTQPEGLVRMYVKFLYDEEKIVLYVEDTGIGMNSEHLSHVFNRFYKADEARSAKNGGMGLGLSIAKEIINTHNGEISVTSEVDKGSRFMITLPIRFVKHEQTLQSEYSI